MMQRRVWLTAAAAVAPLASFAPASAWSQPAGCSPGLAVLSQRMGKAWLCLADPLLATRAEGVLAASQAGFEQALAQSLRRATTGPAQAGSLRALARRYEDYKALLDTAPSAEAQRQLLPTANEMLTLAQLASDPRDATPWQAHLAQRQRLLSQRVAVLALAPGAEGARRERQAAIYEFEASWQTLRAAPGTGAALRDRLDLAQAAWAPLRDGALSGRALPVFMASEQLLRVMDGVTEHCSRVSA